VLEAVRLKGNGAPPPEMTPVRLRVSLSKGAPPLHVGDRLLVLANLSPPAGPAAPGAFDFQRVAWYQQLGAVGYALAPAAVIEPGKPDGFVRAIDALRADVVERIMKALPGPKAVWSQRSSLVSRPRSTRTSPRRCAIRVWPTSCRSRACTSCLSSPW
jgi:competence protein ComEC